MSGLGISLQINEIPSRIVLERFLLEGRVRAVGSLDNTINNEKNTSLTISDGILIPWHQDSPLNPLGYRQGMLKIEDIILLYPLDPAEQAKTILMPHSERAIVYAADFAIHGNMTMGADANVLTALDSITKRFMALTQVSIFPLFTARTGIPEVVPVVLLNKDKVYQAHSAE